MFPQKSTKKKTAQTAVKSKKTQTAVKSKAGIIDITSTHAHP